jgi:hypothetical protein
MTTMAMAGLLRNISANLVGRSPGTVEYEITATPPGKTRPHQPRASARTVFELRAEPPGSGRESGIGVPRVIIEIQQKIAGLLRVQGLSRVSRSSEGIPRHQGQFCPGSPHTTRRALSRHELRVTCRTHPHPPRGRHLRRSRHRIFGVRQRLRERHPLRGQREASAGRRDQASPPPTASVGTASRSSPSSAGRAVCGAL